MPAIPQPGDNSASSTSPASSESMSPVPAELDSRVDNGEAPEGPLNAHNVVSEQKSTGSEARHPDKEEIADDEEDSLPREDRHVTPEVRYYNFEGFMNRMVGDQGDYVIEVLVTNRDWLQDFNEEDWKRVRRSNRAYDFNGKPQQENAKDFKKVQLKLAQGSKTPQDGLIKCIRIRSLPLCRVLSWLCNIIPRHAGILEFYPPFKVIEYTYASFKHIEMVRFVSSGLNHHIARTLLFGGDELLESEKPIIVSDHTQRFEERGDEYKDFRTSAEIAIQHKRCYVDFVEKVILPMRSKFERYDEKIRPTIRYDEIPYLFQAGGLVSLPLPYMNRQTLQRSSVQQIWRMASCRPAPTRTNMENSSKNVTEWGIYCLDWDGDKLVTVWSTVTFKVFDGERDITSLECYPLKLHSQYDTLLEEQAQLGQVFKSHVTNSIRHLYYTGWTPITGIRAESLTDDKGDEIRYPEYIESEVVIDFKEALRNHPYWETEYREAMIVGYETSIFESDKFSVWEAYPTGRNVSRRRYTESIHMIVQVDEIYDRESRLWSNNDRFITGKGGLEDNPWSREDLALLSKRLFGYVLRERRFARLDVRGIDTSTQRSGVSLDNIQMQASRRRIIRSAVSAHFKSRQKEKQGQSTINLDIIRGKGKGLVMLLHGPPGVGKTATAEAVAIENSKPLFPITCGDLGFTPSSVDKTLRDIFRYAHLWECILLLDEADIFLTQRKSHGGSLERHALVGVFLRVLEYYSGILFITTNRIGAIDEAFQSRAHLTLYYPHLSMGDTIEILSSNLKRLPRVKQEGNNSSNDYIKVMDDEIKDFIKTEYDKYSKATRKNKGPWNGRQIRNAVQIAAGLALYDKETAKEDDGLPAILTAGHFRSVAETMSEFEDYLKTARAGDDAYLTRQRQDRNDDFQHEGAGPFHTSPGFSPEPQMTPRSSRSNALPPGSTGSATTRRKGPPGNVSTMARKGPLHIDDSNPGYTGSAKSPTNQNRPIQRTRHYHGQFEYDEDDFEERHDDFGEGEEHEDRDDSPSYQAVSYGRKVSPFGRRADRFDWK